MNSFNMIENMNKISHERLKLKGIKEKSKKKILMGSDPENWGIFRIY